MAVEGLVGEAWVLIRPYTGDFAPTLKKELGAGMAAADTELAAGGGMIGPKTIAASEKQAATAAERVAGTFNKRMDKVGHHAVSGGTAALLGGLAIAETGKQVVDAATSFETAEASVASQTGQTMTQVKGLGKAFLDTARNGQVMFKAADLAKSYAGVSGQLKLTTGHVLTNSQALKFMKASEDAAEASGGELQGSTSALSSTMQAFHLKIKNVNEEADLLYNVSRALNLPIESVSTAVNRLHTRLGIAAPTLSDTGALMVSFGKAGVQGQRGLMVVNSALSTLLGSAKKAAPAKKASEASIMAARIAEQSATDATTKALKTYGKQSEQYAIAVERQKLASQRYADIQKPVAAKLTATQQAVKDLGLTVFDQHGKFVGMSKLIEQLTPKLDKMSQKQRTAALQTLFGKTAAQLMGQVIQQGVPGWNNATAAVDRHGSAQRGAELQAKTLKGQTRILGSQMDALAVEVGQKVIPVLTSATGWLVKHKGATEALAGVIGGILVLAVGRYVAKLLWSTGKTTVEIAKQIAQWTGLSKKVEETKAAADSTSKSIGGAGAKAGAELETGAATASSEIEAGAATASEEMAAGGTAAEGELAAGGATAEAEMAAGGATAEGELAAGGAAGGGGGALGKLGMIGKGGLVVGAGVAAYVGTHELLKHTPLGTGVVDAAGAVAHLFGVGKVDPNKNLTPTSIAYRKALDDAAKQLGESEDAAFNDPRAKAIASQKMGWGKPKSTPVAPPPGWHAPMAPPTAGNENKLEKLIAQNDQHARNQEAYANTGNAQLAKLARLAEQIDTRLATAHHHRHQRRFSSAEDR